MTKRPSLLWIGCLTAVTLLALLPGRARPEEVKVSEGWTTYRGNPQRTGNTDGTSAPTNPKVLWVLKSQEHFVASPVPLGDQLFVSSLGAFNISTVYALATSPSATERTAWAKSSPYLKLPTVGSPVLSEGRLIFGDGMHQTHGATLHCLRADKGQPVWQLPLPGQLVHLEGAPTVAGSRVYVGGGAAGVLCVDPNRVTLDGKELDGKEIQKILDAKWAALLAKYEEDKKKDPDFARKPTEDDLPRPAPLLLWQEGKEKWHVDAPVAVVGERVLAASARLDDEQVGDRCLLCLEAKTGKVLWRTPLRLNPWGGPSVQGSLVVVGGSSVRYDPTMLKGAKGVVAAFDLATGEEKWHKDVTGGVVSCAALTSEVAIVTATDGKVRAFDLGDGERKWVYDAKAPFFAPVAVAGGVVYAGDLRGVVHALGLADGQRQWTLDLATHPDVKAPGMIYAGPVVHGGRVYVATCNLEGQPGKQATVVVCLGDK